MLAKLRVERKLFPLKNLKEMCVFAQVESWEVREEVSLWKCWWKCVSLHKLRVERKSFPLKILPANVYLLVIFYSRSFAKSNAWISHHWRGRGFEATRVTISYVFCWITRPLLWTLTVITVAVCSLCWSIMITFSL